MKILRFMSRTHFILAAIAVFSAGAALLMGLLKLNLRLDAPLALAYPGGKLLAVWWVMSAPLLWLCRARAREIGVKQGGVLAVWAICSTLLVAYLAIVWNMGRSWAGASEFVIAAVSSIGISAIGLGVSSLLWLAFFRRAPRTPSRGAD